MEVEITPEPSPEERQALLALLERTDEARREPSAWWEAGAREAVEEEPED